jgi:hypothetical protein
VIISLGLAALLAGADPAAGPPTSTKTLEVKNACLEAVSGDPAAELTCIKAILEHAEPMRVDELSPEFSTNCLVIPTLGHNDLIWAYLGWLNEHPETDEKPASMTINAALLDKVPCGWQKG